MYYVHFLHYYEYLKTMNILAKLYFYPAVTVAGISASSNCFHLLCSNLSNIPKNTSNEVTRTAFSTVYDILGKNKQETEPKKCLNNNCSLTKSSIICNSLINGSLWWTLPWTVYRGYFKGEKDGADFTILENILDNRKMIGCGDYRCNVYYLYGNYSVSVMNQPE